MRDESFEMTRTLTAMIDQVDRRSMDRLNNTWAYDDMPTSRVPAMKRYLAKCERATCPSLLPFLRVEQLQAACRALRVKADGCREELELRLKCESSVDLVGLGPRSKAAKRLRLLLREVMEREDITECEFEARLEAIIEGASDPGPGVCSVPVEKTAGKKSRKRGSAKKESNKSDEAPKVQHAGGLDLVGGMTGLKTILVDEVIEPLRNPEKYRNYGLGLPNGILLYGPPGCGKTFIAKNLAAELGHHFIEVLPSTVGSPFIHETTTRIAGVFAEALENAPAIIFIDELDALAPARGDLDGTSSYKAEEVNELLAQLNNAGERGILVLGATNEMDKIDPAVLRSGRFDRQFHVDVPDADAREEILRLALAGRYVEDDLDLTAVVKKTKGLTCADLRLLVDDAARLALKVDKPIGEWGLLRAAANAVDATRDAGAS